MINLEKLLLILSCFLLLIPVYANENDQYNEVYIKFSKSRLTVQQALNELDKLPEVSIVYNGNEKFLYLTLILPDTLISVHQALQEIKQQAPVSISYNNGHIIVKAQKLEESYQLKGSILDSETHEGLIAADVYLPGTSKGTVTDLEGNFSISLEPGSYEIVARYTGYIEKHYRINLYAATELTVYLHAKKHEIQEVNIVGSMDELDELATGRPIEKIEGKTINQLSTNDVNDALHGRINGVWTTKVSGAPGDHNKIRVRGISSIFGSTDPLYVIDGVIVPVVNFKTLGIADLNSHNIEKITVLKDASSTALYGYLGGNGVILVETKKGGGETKFNFSIKQGFQENRKRYSLMNTEDFLSTVKRSDGMLGTTFYSSEQRLNYEKYPVYYNEVRGELGSTDFQDEIFQRGSIREVEFSGQGNTLSVDYYLSGNYYTHSGVVANTKYDKYSFTGNISRIFGEKLSLRLLYKGSAQQNQNTIDNYLGNNVIYKGINFEPGYYFTADSFLRKQDRLYLNNIGSKNFGRTVNELSQHEFSPHDLIYKQSKVKDDFTHSASFQGLYRLNNHFSFHARYSVYRKNLKYESFLPKSSELDSSKYLLSNERVTIISQQYDLHYKKIYNDHKTRAFLSFRSYRDNIFWKVDSLKDVELESLTSESNVYLRGSASIYGARGSIIRRLNAVIASFVYSFREKYTASIIANLDFLREGSFVKQNQLFPSLALDWDLSKEPILRLPHWIDALHLYTNWGMVGNYPLNSVSNDIYVPSEYGYSNRTPTVHISSLANHHLRHEQVEEINLGTSFSLFNRRINLQTDYYIKQNKHLILQREVPKYYGGGFFFQNVGAMQNRGVEISLEFSPFRRTNFEWLSSLGYASNHQILTELYDSTTISFNNTDLLYPDFYAAENKELGSIYGYQFAGTWNEAIHSEEVNGYRKYLNYFGSAYLKTDTSNYSQLTEEDKVVIGNSIPDFTCNWINHFRYKNLSFDMLWYAVIGVSKYNATKATTYIAGTNKGLSEFVFDTLRHHRFPSFYESSFFVEPASFIRLKTLTIRYKQPREILSSVAIEYALSFENLVTLSHYSGYDPEASIYTNNNFSDNAMDRGSYPIPQGVFFSVNLSF